jgi:hypothetical protein
MSGRNNFVLDDTLRFLYITLRNHRVPLVAIEFIHRGKKWRVDTAQEAIELRRRLEDIDEEEDQIGIFPEDYIRAESVWTPDVFWDFVHNLGSQQRELLESLLEGSKNSTELTERLKLESEFALGGVISGLSKQLRRLELKPVDLYVVSTDWRHNERIRIFFIQRAFKLAAEEMGWPEEKKRKSK